MSELTCSETGGQAARRTTGAPRTADVLALAASPTFGTMALLTSLQGGGPAEMFCATAHASPLGGMATMYLLMSAFHAAPWLRLVRAKVRP